MGKEDNKPGSGKCCTERGVDLYKYRSMERGVGKKYNE